MRALLTGASGFVGSNVLKYLLDKTDLTFVCPASFRHRGNPLRMKPNDRVEVPTLDLSGVIPDLGRFDYIVNLASESHVDRSLNDPIPFVENNISTMLQILDYAIIHPPKVFLHFSTDEVYGAMDHQDWDVLLPSNPYAASKAAQEMLAVAYWKSYGVPIVITNSNNIVGPGQDPEKFVPKIIDLIKHDKIVPIHAVDGKPGRRYWNPVTNIADALLFILGREAVEYPDSDRPDRYSLTGGEELDNLEMARLIADILGKELLYELVDAEEVRPGYDEFYASTDGLEKLGWKPPVTLKESLSWIT